MARRCQIRCHGTYRCHDIVDVIAPNSMQISAKLGATAPLVATRFKVPWHLIRYHVGSKLDAMAPIDAMAINKVPLRCHEISGAMAPTDYCIQCS